MGELEPDDSRDVTLNPDTAPGEPPRTGPREGEARRKARRDHDEAAPPRDGQPARPNRKGTMTRQQQHEGRQGQSQSGGQSQRQTSAGKADDGPARQTGEPQLNNPISEGPLAGDQPQGIDNPAGAEQPAYDQYEVNSPQNMHHDRDAEARRRQQAEMQDGQAKANDDADSGEAHDASERGYGGASEERKERLDEG